MTQKIYGLFLILLSLMFAGLTLLRGSELLMSLSGVSPSITSLVVGSLIMLLFAYMAWKSFRNGWVKLKPKGTTNEPVDADNDSIPPLFWRLRRVRAGRKFGNRIADALTINRSLFHSALEEGGLSMHLYTLASLEDEGTSPHEAGRQLNTLLLTGLGKLQTRFGERKEIVHAIDVLATSGGAEHG